MLYKQEHRGRIHLYWSIDDIIANRVSIGKLDDIQSIISIFFGNKSRNKSAILKILKIFERFNLVDFLSQDKRKILAEIKEITG